MYILGGAVSDSTNTMFRYDPVANTYITAANFLSAIKLRIPGFGQAPSTPTRTTVAAALMTEAAAGPAVEGDQKK